MTWWMRVAAPFLDGLIQRTLQNKKTTAGGVGIGAAVTAVILYLESQGCDVSSVKWMGLIPVIQGAYSTDADKTLDRTVGDDEHDKAGQG